MNHISETIPASKAKTYFSQLLRRMREQHESFAITQRGKVEGVLLNIEEYDRSDNTSDSERSSIISLTHPDRDIRSVARELKSNNIDVSVRQNRAGQPFVRLSPHFYNTDREIEQIASVMK